jgi:hypothetical protein
MPGANDPVRIVPRSANDADDGPASKPHWDKYACDLAQRLGAREHLASVPSVLVVGVLGYVVENGTNVGVDERDLAMCRSWLGRLVDERGNPLDDRGRNAIVAAVEENALNHGGSLSSIIAEDDRVTFRITVGRRARSLPRGELRERLTVHAYSYVGTCSTSSTGSSRLPATDAKAALPRVLVTLYGRESNWTP